MPLAAGFRASRGGGPQRAPRRLHVLSSYYGGIKILIIANAGNGISIITRARDISCAFELELRIDIPLYARCNSAVPPRYRARVSAMGHAKGNRTGGLLQKTLPHTHMAQKRLQAWRALAAA